MAKIIGSWVFWGHKTPMPRKWVSRWERNNWVTLDCRDAVHEACDICPCYCHSEAGAVVGMSVPEAASADYGQGQSTTVP